MFKNIEIDNQKPEGCKYLSDEFVRQILYNDLGDDS